MRRSDSKIVHRLFPQPTYSDAEVEIRIDAGLASYRSRDRGTSVMRARYVFVTSRANAPRLAQLRFDRNTSYQALDPGATIRFVVEYDFQGISCESVYERESGCIKIYRAAASLMDVLPRDLARTRRECELTHRFTFHIDCVDGVEQILSF